MVQIFEYYSRYQGVRGRFGALPGWARMLLGISAVPGILLALLSIVVFLVSLLALLLFALPVYRVLSYLCGGPKSEQTLEQPPAGMASPVRRHVEVKIINETQAVPVENRLLDGSVDPEQT